MGHVVANVVSDLLDNPEAAVRCYMFVEVDKRRMVDCGLRRSLLGCSSGQLGHQNYCMPCTCRTRPQATFPAAC